jgi:antitoxin component YwqK of YwqJK toxin-antitoxin module
MQKVKTSLFIASLALVISCSLNAQQNIFGESKPSKTYLEKNILDPEYGINKFDKLNPMIGGDSIRNGSKGYALQGWKEDYYTNGKLLHRGFYSEGQTKLYKNYYDNGQLERDFAVTDMKRSKMKIYFKDGKLKAEIDYCDGNTIKEQDFYPSGQLKYTEEHSSNMEYLLQLNSYAENGKPQSLFEITDKKKKIYYKKEYTEKGVIKEEGPMRYSKAVLDYQKNGTWKIYDENGNLKSTDNFVNGQGGNSN